MLGLLLAAVTPLSVMASTTGTMVSDESWSISFVTYIMAAFVMGLFLGLIAIVADSETKFVQSEQISAPRRVEGPTFVHIMDTDQYAKVEPVHRSHRSRH
jgi:hypothetical protein